MKRFLIFAIFAVAVQATFAQSKNDPSVSVHNYKHPDKAAYARKHNLDKNIKLKEIQVRSNDNYKHPQKTSEKNSNAIPTEKSSKGMRKKSYKHPNGL